METFTIDEATRLIRANGYAGLCLWQVGTGDKSWMACLMREPGVPTYDNLWHYVDSAQAALIALVEAAERHPHTGG